MGASYGGQNGSETIQRSITRWPITDETGLRAVDSYKSSEKWITIQKKKAQGKG